MIGIIVIKKLEYINMNIDIDIYYKIEDKFYCVKNIQNFILKLHNFTGYINIIIPKGKKHYRFYLHYISEDAFTFPIIFSSIFIYFEGNGEFMINKIDYENPYINIDDLFINYGYKQFIISQDLLHLKNKLKNAYNLDYYQENRIEGTLLFGLYNNIDLQILDKIDRKEKVGILWGGSDIMLNSKIRNKVLKIIIERGYDNYAMSDYILNKLDNLGIKNKKKICVSFCWNDKNYKDDKDDNDDTHIFIYDGIGNNNKKNEIYGKKIVDKICLLNSQLYPIVKTSTSYIKNILPVYKKSFVSLRLTKYDGNANTAQECGMFGIPVISNQDMNHCISWKNSHEIIKKINYIKNNRIKIYWKKDKINLLFISNDKIGKGGGATFTYRLTKYLEKRGFNIWSVYLNNTNNMNNTAKIEGNIIKINLNMKKSWKIMDKLLSIENKEFKEFLGRNYKIILRSYIPLEELQTFQKSEIIFMIPGIFKNNLDNDWKKLDVKNIFNFLNLSNFSIANKINSFCNSSFTQNIYQKYGTTTNVLEINLLQMVEKNWENNREIDYLFVVSDIKRNIKNLKLFIELRNRLSGKFCIISGEKVDKKVDGIEYIEGLEEDKLEKYYQKSKILLNTSFFDSMSNAVLEGIKYGCFVLVSENNGIKDYIGSEHIIEGYEIDKWEKRCLEVIEMINHGESEVIRKNTFKKLLEKSWEVEIKLLELLSI